MKKQIIALSTAALMILILFTACGGGDSSIKIAMITDGNAPSDNHLNQAVWQGLLLIEDDLDGDVNFFRPSTGSTEEYLLGVATLTQEGYSTIVMAGTLMAEAFFQACLQYPDASFIGIDIDPLDREIPQNAVILLFNKAQAGFLAGVAAGFEKPDLRFGALFGSDLPGAKELAAGFSQGVHYAQEISGGRATAENSDQVFLSDIDNYPLGQREASNLYDKGVDCLLVSSDPTGLGAAAEGRMRSYYDGSLVVGSDADFTVTCQVDEDKSASLTSAICDYSGALVSTVSDLMAGDRTILGSSRIFDLSTDSVGLPEENPNLSKETLEEVETAKEKVLSGEIVITFSDES